MTLLKFVDFNQQYENQSQVTPGLNLVHFGDFELKCAQIIKKSNEKRSCEYGRCVKKNSF